MPNLNQEQISDLRRQLQEGAVQGHRVDFIDNPFPDIIEANIPSLENIKKVFDHKYLLLFATNLLNFLNTPLVEDHFGDKDTARDPWEKAVHKALKGGTDVIQENRYRPNKLQLVTVSIQELAAILLEDLNQSAEGNFIKTLYRLVPVFSAEAKAYKRLPTEEKKQIVHQLSLIAVITLEVLSGKTINPDDSRIQTIRQIYEHFKDKN